MKYHHPDIISDDNDPSAPLTRPTNLHPDHPNVVVQGPYYHVSNDVSRVPFDDYLFHGYETRKEFQESINDTIRRWGGRTGECVEVRVFHGKDGIALDLDNRLLHLRFHDAPGHTPEAAWLPVYLLDPATPPPCIRSPDSTPDEQLLDEIDARLWEKHKRHRR